MRRRAKPEAGAADADERAVRGAALAQLARRDFGREELRAWLLQRGYAAPQVEAVLEGLAAERLLDDVRVLESAVRQRSGRGKGPQRLRAELRQRGLDSGLVDTALKEADVDWAQLAIEVRRRRFGAVPPSDARERAKQSRFLQYRGFSSEHIRAAFGTREGDPDFDDTSSEPDP